MPRPLGKRAQIAADHQLALRLARHECVDAGMSEHKALTQDVVVQSQGARFQTLQQVSSDRRLAVRTARHECVDAGLSEHHVLTDAFVEQSQHGALTATQPQRSLTTPRRARRAAAANLQPPAPKALTAPAAAPKAITPPAAAPKAPTPPVAAPKAITPPAASPKALTPPAPSPKAPTPPAASPKAPTPPAPSPKALTPPAASPKAPTPPAAAPGPTQATSRAAKAPLAPERSNKAAARTARISTALAAAATRGAINAPTRQALRRKLRGHSDLLQSANPRATLVEVVPDGNCGYFSLLAGLVRMSMSRPDLAANLQTLPKARFEGRLGDDKAAEGTQSPECAKGRRVLKAYMRLIGRGMGDQVLHNLHTHYDNAHAAQMALRSAFAVLDDKEVPSRSSVWAEGQEIKRLAQSLGVDANIYTTDSSMHRTLLNNAGIGPNANTLSILHTGNHFDLILPNG